MFLIMNSTDFGDLPPFSPHQQTDIDNYQVKEFATEFQGR